MYIHVHYTCIIVVKRLPCFPVDGLYAVYEASTLELWSLMMYTAIEGRSVELPIIFYFLLFMFLVIILQVSRQLCMIVYH